MDAAYQRNKTILITTFITMAVTSVNPKPRMTERILGYISHNFPKNLAPAESFEIEFALRAKDAGLWGGDIDACTPTQNLVTHYTEIEVLVPEPAGSIGE